MLVLAHLAHVKLLSFYHSHLIF